MTDPEHNHQEPLDADAEAPETTDRDESPLVEIESSEVDSFAVVTLDAPEPVETSAQPTMQPNYETPILLETVIPPAEDGDQPPEVAFEDLTLAEALSQFRRQPLTTLRALVTVARTPMMSAQAKPALRPAYAGAGGRDQAQVVLPGLRRERSAQPRPDVPEIPQIEDVVSARVELLQLVLRAAAFLLAWWGTLTMVSAETRSEFDGLNVGMPFLLVGFAVWLVSEFFSGRGSVSLVAHESGDDTAVSARRLIVLAAAIALGGAAVWLTLDNRITLPGWLAWAGSIALGIAALAPAGGSPAKLVERLASIRFRPSWTALALIAIMLVGAYFRLTDLDLLPREMTSDHVEMLLDSERLFHGASDVFFANNGGRESMQFYALALVSMLPGLGVDFHTLKLLNAIEGVLTIPVLFWMGRAIIGERERHLGTLVGLLAAAFVAVSYWHVIISRLGERIVLMPLATALLVLFLARALRGNRRGDFVLAGLALGFGLYTYQAFRMMPLVVLVCMVVALFFYLRRDGRRFLLNCLALGLVALIVYLPLFSYSVQYPEDYWRRTSGRLFGDEITQTTDEDGNLIFRQPTLEERVEAFQQNFPTLVTNIRNALLMYNWKGDVAWFQNYPNEPAFDPITGGLIVVGAAAWIGRIFRRRDPFTWALPVVFMILLLPSAFAIAQPLENPSFTRMSGTLPLAFLLVALPLAVMLRSTLRLIGGIGGVLVALLIAVGLVAGSFASNRTTYFEDYQETYLISAYPYSEAGLYLRSFGENTGFGNTFIINRPAWWDHRAVGIAAGQMDYPNGIPDLASVPQYLQDARGHAEPYMLDINRDILLFMAADDVATQEWLRAKFPDGAVQLIQTYQPEDSFVLFRIPPLGEDGFAAFIEDAADDDLLQQVG